ncbi:MAG: 16S rRNA (guanine(527)-N(7))-methyltransferase RsmG [Pseudorhodobacter sp.]
MCAPDHKALISPAAGQQLETYLSILRKWNPAINLVSAKTLDDAWTRHFLDSAQIYHLSGSSGGHWVDMGSGAGFPGIVIAILLKEDHPAGRVTLIEADRRKAAFLSTVVAKLDLPCTVLVDRIEAVPSQAADWVCARALAPLKVLLGFAEQHMVGSGVALFPKGRSYHSEIEDAREDWVFDIEILKSRTGPDGAILRIAGIGRKAGQGT